MAECLGHASVGPLAQAAASFVEREAANGRDPNAHGGMAIAYKARQPALNRIVGRKVLLGGEPASDEVRRRFRLEAEAVARVQHPHVVTVLDIGQHLGMSIGDDGTVRAWNSR